MIIGIFFGCILGFLINTLALDYAETHWYDHIYHDFHKDRHDDPQINYSVVSNITNLGPFTLTQAKTTIGQAASAWNSGSDNIFKFAEGSGNDIFQYYKKERALGWANWDYETIGGRSYIQDTENWIKLNSKHIWSLNGNDTSFSLKAVCLHEMGHWLDLDDITTVGMEDAIMWHEMDEGTDKNNLDSLDENTVERIYKDCLWELFDVEIYYNDGSSNVSIRSKDWEPAFHEDSSSGPTNPPDLEEASYRKFYIVIGAKKGDYEFDYPPHYLDSTMRILWDDDYLDRDSEGWWVDSPYVTKDTWWFGTNPQWSSDDGYLCVNFNPNNYNHLQYKQAEMYVRLEAVEVGSHIPVTTRITSADYHSTPWIQRDEVTFRFDINT